mmetsp:Transcript_94072/g.275286  ORF Transcript_94072/g.275286 Transcript_94072/m.275286 type:complete len:274 (-) Transcript_94072:155-976(-)
MNLFTSLLVVAGLLPGMEYQSAALTPPSLPSAPGDPNPMDEVLPRVRVESSELGQELIIDETFASLYVPGRIATHNVWDALAAPILALPPERRKRVLLLGLGGGSAARILRALAPEALIVGVEIDPEVVAAACTHFGLGDLGLEIVTDDALHVLQTERRRFDLVIDDVFLGCGNAVRKPDWIPEPGHTLALRRLREGGLFVCNTITEAKKIAPTLRERFQGLLRIDVEGYWNSIFVAGPAELSAKALRGAVRKSPVLSGALPVLSFRDARKSR